MENREYYLFLVIVLIAFDSIFNKSLQFQIGIKIMLRALLWRSASPAS
jgi:hypothetical protein